MVIGVRDLVQQVESNPAVVSRLTDILEAAGFEDATDVAMLNDKMVVKILGEEAESLGGVLRRAVKAAEPILKGWVTEINGGVERRGAVPGSARLCLAKLPPRPFPAPGEPPASMCMRWVRPGLAEKRAARHLVCFGPSVF